MLPVPVAGLKRPKARFTLLQLDDGEIYFKQARVRYANHPNVAASPGRLRLCSRCIVFESKDPKVPLTKIRWSSVTQFDKLHANPTQPAASPLNSIFAFPFSPSGGSDASTSVFPGLSPVSGTHTDTRGEAISVNGSTTNTNTTETLLDVFSPASAVSSVQFSPRFDFPSFEQQQQQQQQQQQTQTPSQSIMTSSSLPVNGGGLSVGTVLPPASSTPIPPPSSFDSTQSAVGSSLSSLSSDLSVHIPAPLQLPVTVPMNVTYPGPSPHHRDRERIRSLPSGLISSPRLMADVSPTPLLSTVHVPDLTSQFSSDMIPPPFLLSPDLNRHEIQNAVDNAGLEKLQEQQQFLSQPGSLSGRPPRQPSARSLLNGSVAASSPASSIQGGVGSNLNQLSAYADLLATVNFSTELVLCVTASSFEEISTAVPSPHQLRAGSRLHLLVIPLREASRFVPDLEAVQTASRVQSSSKEDAMDAVISKCISEARFQSSWIVSAEEKVILETKATRVKPAGHQPGLFVLTDAAFYFQPFYNHTGKSQRKVVRLCGLACVIKQRHMLRHVGIEMWVANRDRSFLFCFEDVASRDWVHKAILDQPNANRIKVESIENATKKWETGIISNFEYLMFLNVLGGRTFNDLTQYPVFPWVIADYTSSKLDLESTSTFRDLSKPIGALNDERLANYKERFEDMQDPSLDQRTGTEFLYGTHYSVPGYVIHYLIRVIPDFMIRLQRGTFDAADRLFRSVEAAWWSSLNVSSDVKELVPEFYCGTGSFLLNSEDIDMGKTQDGDRTADVILPPWAKSPSDFVLRMREALESDYVSSRLHLWIDLIFGCKLHGDEALRADNLFYYLTYEGQVSWDDVKDPVERSSLLTQIKEFGQCPVKLFQQPHPIRQARRLLLKDPTRILSRGDHQLLAQFQLRCAELDRARVELAELRKTEGEAKTTFRRILKNIAHKRETELERLTRNKNGELALKNSEIAELRAEIETLKKDLEDFGRYKDEFYHKIIAELNRKHRLELDKYINKFSTAQYVKSLETEVATLKLRESQNIQQIDRLTLQLCRLDNLNRKLTTEQRDGRTKAPKSDKRGRDLESSPSVSPTFEDVDSLKRENYQLKAQIEAFRAKVKGRHNSNGGTV